MKVNLFIISVTTFGELLDFGQLLKPLAAIYLPKSPTFLGIFCKGVKIYHFSSEFIFGQLLYTVGNFFLVTLFMMDELEDHAGRARTMN